MMDLLLEPLALPFLQRAFAVATLVALPMALISPILVLRGWALMGDAIAHAVLPGVVISYLAGLPIVVGAFGAGMGCALLIGYVSEHSRVKEDTVMGVVFSAMFAVGIVLYASIETEVHLDHILFGNMLGVDAGDLWLAGGIALSVAAAIAVFGRDLALMVFDPTHGRALGLPIRLFHYGLLALVSLTVVGALSAVGLILAIAFLIAPAATALLWSRRMGRVTAISALVAVAASWAGIYLSVWIGSAPAPTIVVILSVLFLLSFGLTTLRRSRI